MGYPLSLWAAESNFLGLRVDLTTGMIRSDYLSERSDMG